MPAKRRSPVFRRTQSALCDAMLSVRQAASFLGISASKVYELAAARRIVHFRIGGKILFEEADLRAYRESCRVGAAAVKTAAAPIPTLRHLRPRPSVTTT
jgi:excisionase family DNA binding protein